MIGTEQKYMEMRNGKKFATGNHPVEMFVPLLHMRRAGFTIEVATPSGKPVQIEEWALPEKDEAVMGIYHDFKSQLENPQSLNELTENKQLTSKDYAAVFIPGGHGAMLGLPEDEKVQKVLRWVRENDKYLFAICHGPAALLADQKEGEPKDFPYKGYKIAAFPDRLDRITPWMGYLPGRMPWYFGEKLKSLGVEIVNKSANGTCQQDRKLVTGDSPEAANEFGEMAVRALLQEK
jgi:molecular chaperone Hsp31 and glyoxalase 3